MRSYTEGLLRKRSGIAALLCVLSFSGCHLGGELGGVGEPADSEPTGTIDGPEGVSVEVIRPILLAEETILPGQLNVSAVEVWPDRLVFSFEGAPPEIPVGAVLPGVDPTPYLRRAASVGTPVAGRLTVQTESAVLTDAISEGQFRVRVDAPAASWLQRDDPFAQLSQPLSGAQVHNFLPDVDFGNGCNLDGDTALELRANLDLLPVLEFSPNIVGGGLLPPRAPRLESLEVKMGGTLEAGASASFRSNATFTCDWDLLESAGIPESLRSVEITTRFTLPTPLGPLPMSVTHTISPLADARVEANLRGPSFQLGQMVELTATVAARYDGTGGGWSVDPVLEQSGQVTSDIDPEAEATALAQINGGIRHDMLVYDLLGPRFEVRRFLEATAEASTRTCTFGARLRAGFTGLLGVAVLDVPYIEDVIRDLDEMFELSSRILDETSGMLPNCEPPMEEPIAEDPTLVSASGDFTPTMGSLEVAVSPQDANGDFVGESLPIGAFRFEDMQMVRSSDGSQVDVSATPTRVEVDKPREDAGIIAVIIFDSSGSMSSNDPGASGRRLGGQAFIDALGPGDRAAVLDFGAGTTNGLVSSRLLQDFTGDTNALRQALGQLEESGGTPLYPSIQDGLGLLAAELGTGGVLVVLTDGAADSRGRLDETITLARAQDVPIYTVGLGTNLDFSDLRRLSQETGGGFAQASDAEALATTFGGISAGITRGRVIVFGDATYSAGMASFGPHSVSGTLVTDDPRGGTFRTPFDFVVDVD
jgi:Mg-chelatase subunit ChlD